MGEAAHHLVAKAAKGAERARAVLDKFEINVHDPVNGVILPAKLHSSIHTKAYYERVNDLISEASSREEVLDILSRMRKELEDLAAKWKTSGGECCK